MNGSSQKTSLELDLGKLLYRRRLYEGEKITGLTINVHKVKVKEKIESLISALDEMEVRPVQQKSLIKALALKIISYLYSSTIGNKEKLMEELRNAFESLKSLGHECISFGPGTGNSFSYQQTLQDLLYVLGKKSLFNSFDYERFLGIKTLYASVEDEKQMRKHYKLMLPSDEYLFKGIRPFQFLSEQICQEIVVGEHCSCFTPTPYEALNYIRGRMIEPESSGLLLLINKKRLFEKTNFIFTGGNQGQPELATEEHIQQGKELNLVDKNTLRRFLRDKGIEHKGEHHEIVPLDCIDYIICFDPLR